MGTEDADSGGRMDRPKAAQMTGVYPDNMTFNQLLARLDVLGKATPGEAGIALRTAAEVVGNVVKSTRQGTAAKLENPYFQARSYSTSHDLESGEYRLALFRESGQKGLLGYIILKSPELYDMATDFMRGYDKLEGIE